MIASNRAPLCARARRFLPALRLVVAVVGVQVFGVIATAQEVAPPAPLPPPLAEPSYVPPPPVQAASPVVVMSPPVVVVPPPVVVMPPPAQAMPPPAQAMPPPTLGSLENAPDLQAAALDASAQRIGMVYQGIAEKSDGRSDWYVQLAQGQCYMFNAIGDSNVRKLFFYLWDPSDSRVQTVKPEGAMVSSRYCTKVAGNYHIQAKVAEGKGAYALGVYTLISAGASAGIDLDKLADARVAAAEPNVVRFGPPLPMPGPGAKRNQWSFNLSLGACYVLVGVGDDKVEDSKLLLTGPHGKRVAETPNDSPTPALRICPSLAGTYNLEARVGGDGLYRVGLYMKPVAAPMAVVAPQAGSGMMPAVATDPGQRPPTRGEQAASVLNAAANVLGAFRASPQRPAGDIGGGGRGGLGSACGEGNDCASSVCVNQRCSQLCSATSDCPAGYHCGAIPTPMGNLQVCAPH